MVRRSARQLSVVSTISPEYRSMAGRCMACSTWSGTLVGPGMLRNCLPLATLIGWPLLMLVSRFRQLGRPAIEPLVFRPVHVAHDTHITARLARLTHIAA